MPNLSEIETENYELGHQRLWIRSRKSTIISITVKCTQALNYSINSHIKFTQKLTTVLNLRC